MFLFLFLFYDWKTFLNDIVNSFVRKKVLLYFTFTFLLWEEWPSGLRRYNQNWKVPGSKPTRHAVNLGTQPRYEAPSDLWVEYVQTQWLTLGQWGCPLKNDPRLAVAQPNSSLKKRKLSWTALKLGTFAIINFRKWPN